MSAGRPRSLRFQLTAAFLVVAVAPVALLGSYALATALESARRRVAAANGLVAIAVAGELDRFLEAQVVEVGTMRLAFGERSGLYALDPEEHAAIHLAGNPVLKSVLLADRGGRVEQAFPYDPDLRGLDLSGQPWWRQATERQKPTWSSAAISLQTGQPTVTLVVPGPSRSAIAYLDLDVLRDIAGRSGRMAPGAAVSVLDADGTFIAHPDPRLVRERVNVADVPLVRDALRGGAQAGEVELLGRRVVVSTAGVQANGWTVLISEPAEVALAPVAAARDGLAAALAVALLLSVAGGIVVARRVVGPIEDLAERARSLAAGEPPRPLPREGSAETHALSAAFEAMAVAVQAREEALARSEHDYRQLVEAPLVGVARTRPDGRFEFANLTLARMLGAASPGELLDRSPSMFYEDEAQRSDLVARVAAEGRLQNVELRLRRLDGTPLVALANVVLEGDRLSSVLLDVTKIREAQEERKHLEEQLRHAQKLEAVGRLAGGVAHDFNNLLTVVSSYADLLAEAIPRGHADREAVDGIRHSCDRAVQLTRSLLAYSRKQVLRPQPIDVRGVVVEVGALARRLLGEDVEIRIRAVDRPLPVVADRGQLEQVLMNLCTNARDAMPRGGAIEIATDEVVLGADEVANLQLQRAGRYARLAVTDDGEGMSPEVLEHAFEPFFTTKAAGKGTGLGLAQVYGIVRQHEGAVQVRSKPGAGTTFTVLLPAEGQAIEARPAAESPAAAPRGHETILVAEDEPLVRQVMRSTLARAGYEVLEAADGAEAVELFRRHRARVGLCVLDVVMPRLNGKQALEAIQRLDPGARALFLSGYASEVLTARGVEELGAELLQKPVASAELLRAVRAALDRKA